ncbi:MAG: hypothetical protein KKD38_08290 [Candidatus Delongbacteria bacterium]|nr:hypothetical protein [Candidatus Delongbacteria bacterium]MCG2760189.1 hypothetical protein [Candidatus Delongbacteria bacterium]
MGIKFKCSNCNKDILLQSGKTGDMVQCNECKEVVAIPENAITFTTASRAESTGSGFRSGKIYFKNLKSGEVQTVNTCKWDWFLFLFSGLWGIPLLIKKLYVWGSIFFFLQLSYLYYYTQLSSVDSYGSYGSTPPAYSAYILSTIILFILIISLDVYFGLLGNKLLAVNYLENGWKILNKDDNEIKDAFKRWNLDNVFEEVKK